MELSQAPTVVDPVCTMTVKPEAARVAGLYLEHDGQDFYFCGKGCVHEFRDDPGQYFDPNHTPSR